ncbi:uncharacterized protein BXZ73DRAFT_88131 [Epithele typhae]|uniref:uncharacterized protein n=1 Tax=Epithele typhae TaxID=378194 RepID=UPI002008049D|nr:uncharacterized protein BXZ73DRAFT_88131 [Epithele typhae]KAH9941635.1 hypothetical protein BXZ73DRAFT_88131 [Epithele typhae]
MSFLARLFRRVKGPTGFVGRDLEGNRYFEYASTSDDPRRTKRVVKYAKGADMLEYVGGNRRLAVQWLSWMTHTRPHPPSLEELQADVERQRRILNNVAMIEAREKAHAARVAISEAQHTQAQAPASSPRLPDPMHERANECSSNASDTAAERVPFAPPRKEPPSPWKPPPPDEPQSWTPRSAVRRGG